MLRPIRYSALLLAGWASVATGHAQALSAEEAATLRAQIEALSAQVKALEARLDKAETNTATAAATAQQASELAAKKSEGPKIAFKGAPEISDGKGWSFKPRGRLQIDLNSVNAPDTISKPGLGFSNEIRRAYLGFQGTIPGGFSYMTEINVAGGGAGASKVNFTDIYLAYKTGAWTVTAGQIKPFASLEEQNSDLNTSFLERAAFTSAFGFERRVGLSFGYEKGSVLVNGGVFTNNLDELKASDNSYSLDGRVVWMPKLGDTQLHFGASGHYHDLNDSASSVTYSTRPYAHSTDVKFVSTPAIGAVSETGYGIETGLVRGPFHATAEGFWQTVGRPGLSDPTFFGGYGEVGYVLFGGGRSYKSGTMGSIKPDKGLDKGGPGALELNVRYDFLDLNDGGIIGGKQKAYGVSLAWIPVDHVKFLANYIHLDMSDAAILAGTDASYGVDTFGVRAQLDF